MIAKSVEGQLTATSRLISQYDTGTRIYAPYNCRYHRHRFNDSEEWLYNRIIQRLLPTSIGMYEQRIRIHLTSCQRVEPCKVFCDSAGWLIIHTTSPRLLGRSRVQRTYYYAFSPQDLVDHKDEIIALLDEYPLPLSPLRSTAATYSAVAPIETLSNNDTPAQNEPTVAVSPCNSCVMHSTVTGGCARHILSPIICGSPTYTQCVPRTPENTVLIERLRSRYVAGQAVIEKQCVGCMHANNNGRFKSIPKCINCMLNNFNEFAEQLVSNCKGMWVYHDKKNKL